MANPAPTINQINAFNATQGTTIDFNIIGGTDLVRSNRIYIYDLSDNSLICTHLYVSTESIHELPANTDSSIVYESGKSSADFVNGAQYYAQIQTYTDIAGTEGGSGVSVAKMFWCLVDPTLTITTIPSTISTTSYNVSATYTDTSASVVSNIIQQYQFNLYSATGSLLQSSGVVVGSGEQQGTSTTYDISYNFTGLSVGSSYYVTVEVTTTQGMSVNAQSNTFTVSIDTPTLGEATVVNNACDGYISVTSNLSSEYGGSESGEIVSFETDSENVFTKLQVDLEPIQNLHGYDAPWVGGAGVNKYNASAQHINTGASASIDGDTITATANNGALVITGKNAQSFPAGTYTCSAIGTNADGFVIWRYTVANNTETQVGSMATTRTFTANEPFYLGVSIASAKWGQTVVGKIQLETGSTATAWTPWENICPISGHDEVDVSVVGKNLFDGTLLNGYYDADNNGVFVSSANWKATNKIRCKPSTTYVMSGTSYPGGSYNGRSFFWDINGNYLGARGTGANFTSYPNSAYMALYFGVTHVTDVIQIEEGTTATTYEPYTETTVSQDFDVSLTPTSTDTDPYLFKAVGDIYGDRLEEELVGGTVAWNQLIKNPELNNTNNIYGSNGTVTASNGMATITANGVASAYFSFSIDKTIADHVYFVSTDVKLDASNQSNAPTNSYIVTNWNSGGSKAIPSATKGTKKTYSTLLKPTVGDVDKLHFYPFETSTPTPNGDKAYFSSPLLIDLTQMFGSTIADYIYSLEQANAGAGVAWFKKLFPKPYYAYNAGELKSVSGVSAHNMTGFNQWDEEWEVGTINTGSGQNETNGNYFRSKNYIQVLPNTTYYYKTSDDVVYLFYYDADKNYLGYVTVKDGTKTTNANARYLRFVDVSRNSYSASSKPICINLSWDGERDGEYEEYVKHSYPLDSDLTLRGIPKLDASNNLYYDGDTYESDGTATRKYGIVDLGTLVWSVSGSGGNYERMFATVNGIKQSEPTYLANILTAKYLTDTANNTYLHAKDKTISLHGTALYVYDSAFTGKTGEEFKTAMSGVYLVYELATPTTETTAPFTQIQEVSKYGTLEYITNNGIPVGHNTTYMTRDVFGGTLDLVSGRLVVDKKYMIYDGSDGTWALSASWGKTNTAVFYNSKILSDIKYESYDYNQYLCETLPTASRTGLYVNDVQAFGFSGAVNQPQATVRINKTIASDVTTFISWIKANPLHIVVPLTTPLTYQLTPQQIQTLVGVNNVWSEQGDIELSYHIPITNLLVKRQDIDDVSGNWLTLYSQPITQASDMDFTFIDFLNQYGKTYKYALVPLLTQTQSGVEVEVEGGYTVSDEVQSIFDGVFISDSTGSQKCKANVGYGNVNMNQSVGSITPIGSQYPIIVTNSNNRYHNGSISGMIVPDDYYYNGNLSRIDMVNKRNELEQFLTNKRAKIIKDWNSNIWLVMIMDNIDCSFDNNYGMGIVTFNANWLEVGDPTNQEDLQATGLIDVGGV